MLQRYYNLSVNDNQIEYQIMNYPGASPEVSNEVCVANIFASDPEDRGIKPLFKLNNILY